MHRSLSPLALLALASCTSPSPLEVPSLREDPGLVSLLRSTPRMAAILEEAPRHRLQVLVSEVIPGSTPRLIRRGFRVDAEYFYPASAIKTCAAVAACEKLNHWSREHAAPFDLDTELSFHPLFADEEFEALDASNSSGGRISVGHEIRKLFLVSDNRAYNRLYELAGMDSVNASMWRAGLDSVRIRHRLSEFRTPEEQRQVPAITLHRAAFQLELPRRTSLLDLPQDERPGLSAGRAYWTSDDPAERVEEPFDFRPKNSISLVDLQDLNILLLRPELLSESRGFAISSKQRTFLSKAMRELPRDSENPRYDPVDYPDDYVRFLLPGLLRVVPADELLVYDKVGRAYGFSIENAYIVGGDGRAFFITAVLYTNPNETLNDGIYDYETVADPFFADLGEALAERYLRSESRDS